jgi:ribonucleoside-diphosphate reductase alpha chain
MRRVKKRDMEFDVSRRMPATEVYGKDFDELYEKYEAEGKFRRQIPASELFSKIVDAQIETGTHICF